MSSMAQAQSADQEHDARAGLELLRILHGLTRLTRLCPQPSAVSPRIRAAASQYPSGPNRAEPAACGASSAAPAACATNLLLSER